MASLARTLGRLQTLRTPDAHTKFFQRNSWGSQFIPSSRCGSAIFARPFCEKGDSTPTAGRPPIDEEGVAMPSIFPDPREPGQHPLAPLSTEEMQQRQEYWEKLQSTNKPPVYRQKLMEDGRAFAIGSRKRSKAKVWIGNGTGRVLVNGRSWVDYFHRIDHRDKILRPFAVLGLIGKMDVECTIKGGGATGQAEALRHGISRALQNWDPVLRPALKSEGLLTRDSREVESKKYGRKKARKAFQWVKR